MTVKCILTALNLVPWSHVSIRRHGIKGVEYLGGGNVDKVVKRFGDMVIVDSAIIDGIMVIHVR